MFQRRRMLGSLNKANVHSAGRRRRAAAAAWAATGRAAAADWACQLAAAPRRALHLRARPGVPHTLLQRAPCSRGSRLPALHTCTAAQELAARRSRHRAAPSACLRPMGQILAAPPPSPARNSASRAAARVHAAQPPTLHRRHLPPAAVPTHHLLSVLTRNCVTVVARFSFLPSMPATWIMRMRFLLSQSGLPDMPMIVSHVCELVSALQSR